MVEREHDGRWRLLGWDSWPLGGRHLHGASGPGREDPTGMRTDDRPT